MSDDFEESSGMPRWRLSDTWQPLEPPNNDNDGRGGDGQPPGDGGDEGDDGGGIREALSHPVLFSLDQDDFDGLVNNLFEDPRF